MRRLIGTYQNGNYNVTIYTDGTKVRENDLDNLTPSFAENIDVCLTKKCKQGCPFCYEGCTVNGKHSDIINQKWLTTLHPYTEIALNGNDCDHPDFKTLLFTLKKQNVLANVTVNQRQFVENYDMLKLYQDGGFLNGIGISLSDSSDTETLDKMCSMKNYVIHTINGILTQNDYEVLKEKHARILVLGYKFVRRGADYVCGNDRVPANMSWLRSNIRSIISDKSGLGIMSFDNLAIEQLSLRDNTADLVNWDELYMGDDGGYTFYIDAVNGTFAKNSVISEKENFPIGDKSVDEMFNFIKNQYGKRQK